MGLQDCSHRCLRRDRNPEFGKCIRQSCRMMQERQTASDRGNGVAHTVRIEAQQVQWKVFDILARLCDGIPQFLDASAASFRTGYTDGNGRMRRDGGVESLRGRFWLECRSAYTIVTPWLKRWSDTRSRVVVRTVG